MSFGERALVTLCVVLIVGFLGFVGYVIYDAMTAETFDLRKDSWNCTRSHIETTLIPQSIGKTVIMVPTTETVCDQWTRK